MKERKNLLEQATEQTHEAFNLAEKFTVDFIALAKEMEYKKEVDVESTEMCFCLALESLSFKMSVLQDLGQEYREKNKGEISEDDIHSLIIEPMLGQASIFCQMIIFASGLPLTFTKHRGHEDYRSHVLIRETTHLIFKHMGCKISI